MAELKTKQTDASVEAYLNAIEDAERRDDCRAIAAVMRRVTRHEPKMWGTSIVGFGSYHYRYASGREGDWFLVGFSPRKKDLTLYLMGLFAADRRLIEKLGPHKTGGSCLYIKRLADIDLAVLEKVVAASIEDTTRRASAGA